jgi:hypothetical protein
MTTLDGSVLETGSLEAGNGGSDNGSKPSASDLFSGLDRDSRNWIDANGIKSGDPAEMVAGLVTKSREMESLIGRSVRFPDGDAGDEEVSRFYDRVTERLRPSVPSGYAYALPEGLPEDMPYDSDFVDAWRQFSHEARLPAAVSAKAHDWFLQHAARAIEAQKSESRAFHEQLAEASTKVVEDAWGPDGSERYAANREHFDRAVDSLGGDALMRELVETGVLDENRRVLAPRVVLALSEAGRAMFAEDQMVLGGTAGSNPFSDDTRNWEAQNAIIRDDPTLARKLIKSAGKDPQTYRL